MEFNRITMGIGLLILVGLGVVYFFAPNLSPTGFVAASILPPSNQIMEKPTKYMNAIFVDKPLAVIEQDGRAGFLLPGGNSVQFTRDRSSTDQDVVIILNASHTTLTTFHTYPEFVKNEFTYIPPEQLTSADPYVQQLYPNGYYLMPANVGD